MAGPQRLPRLWVQCLRHALFLPLLHLRQCALVGRQHGVAQRLPLRVQQKRAFTLRRDADGLNTSGCNVVAGQQFADHLGGGMPQRGHITLRPAGLRRDNVQRTAGYTQFSAMPVIQTGFDKGAAAVQPQPIVHYSAPAFWSHRFGSINASTEAMASDTARL
ncbi:hypothetical protein D3C79_358660 [compost metagenome]